MMHGVSREYAGFGVVVLVVAALLILPTLFLAPGRDASVFLYIGQGLLRGEVPYRDVWDHKPPLIFLVNGLGLALSAGELWGVWLVRLLCLSASGLLSFALLRPFHGRLIAAGVTLLWMVTLTSLLERGNFTEEFNLPLQFAALFVASRRVRAGRWLFWVGVCAGLAFLLRQNNVGTFAAIVMAVMLRPADSRIWARLAAPAGWAALGAIAVLVPMIAWLVLNGAWGAMWSATFEFSTSYASTTTGARLSALGRGMDLFHWSWLALLAWAGAILYRPILRRQPAGTSPVLLDVVIVGLPLELALASMSGRVYGHYFILWLPLMSVALAGFLGHLVHGPGRWRDVRVAVACILTLAAFVDVDERWLRRNYRDLRDPTADAPVRDAVSWIEEHTARDDRVLVYGADLAPLVMAGRRAPSRFPIPAQLAIRGYGTEALVGEFLADLESRPPAAILDTAHDALPPLDARSRAGWVVPESARSRNYGETPPNFDQFLDLVDRSYERVESADFGWTRWDLYMQRVD